MPHRTGGRILVGVKNVDERSASPCGVIDLTNSSGE
jgi:hypothetical protein